MTSAYKCCVWEGSPICYVKSDESVQQDLVSKIKTVVIKNRLKRWPAHQIGQLNLGGKNDDRSYRSIMEARIWNFLKSVEICKVLDRPVQNPNPFERCPSSTYISQCVKQRLQ